MRICALLTVLLSVSLTGCGKETKPLPAADTTAASSTPAAPLIARWHFAGADACNGNTNGSILRDIWKLPASREYLDQVAQRIAAAPAKIWHGRMVETTNDFSTVLQPLVADLFTAESYAEVRGESPETTEFVLAVRLPADRARAWSETLQNVLQTWTGIKATPVDQTGWELKKHHAPNLIRLNRIGDWTVFATGQDKLSQVTALLSQIKAKGRPIAQAADHWVDTAVDWPRFAQWLNLPAKDALPAGLAELKLIGDGEFVRVKGSLASQQTLNDELKTWIVPTNIIREPLVSFTAGQGLAVRLLPTRTLTASGVTPPGQFYVWALASVPFQTYIAAPCSNASNALARLSAHALASFPTNTSTFWGKLDYAATNNRLDWKGLPFIGPFIEVAHDSTGEFLFAGLFPNNPTPSPLPTELLERLQGRTNLVYYDWEITQERLLGWRNLKQLSHIISSEDMSTSNDTGQKWLAAIGPKLGNSATEIIMDGPNHLALTRKSHVGLTGFELVTLVEWVNSPDFPQGGFPWSLHPGGKTDPAHSNP